MKLSWSARFPILTECDTLILRTLGVRVARRWWKEVWRCRVISPGREGCYRVWRHDADLEVIAREIVAANLALGVEPDELPASL